MNAMGNLENYLDEIKVLRNYLLYCVGFFILAFIIFFPVVEFAISAYIIPYFSYYSIAIITTSPEEGLATVLYADLLISFLVSLPVILFFAAKYVLPALNKNEMKLLKFVPIAILLGLIGFAFGLFISIYIMIPFFSNYSASIGLHNLWTLNSVINIVAIMSFALALVFELPIILIPLIKYKILPLQKLQDSRPYVLIAILVISAVITPTPDMVTMLVVAFPLYLIYELTMLYCGLRYSEKVEKESEEKSKKEAKLHG